MEPEINEVVSISENRSDDMERAKYSIFYYCKEHTAFTIACISALVAILSFVIDYAIMLYNHAYLSFWKVDDIYSIQNSKLQLYTVFMAFVLVITTSAISIIMSKTADVYKKNYEFIYIAQKSFRIDRKEIKLCNKRIRAQEKMLKSVGSCLEVNEMQKNLHNQKATIEEIKKRIKNLKKKIRKRSILLLAETLPTAFLAFTAAALVYMMFLMNAVDFEWGRALSIVLKIATPMVLLSLAVYITFNHLLIRKEYAGNSDLNEILANYKFPEENLYPIDKLFFGSAQTFASNTNLKIALFLLCFSSIVCVFMFAFYGQGLAHEKKDFAIYSCEGMDYAIVYNNGESTIMKEAIVDGNNIYIDTCRQQVMSAKDIQFTICSFENVILMERGDHDSVDEETLE